MSDREITWGQWVVFCILGIMHIFAIGFVTFLIFHLVERHIWGMMAILSFMLFVFCCTTISLAKYSLCRE